MLLHFKSMQNKCGIFGLGMDSSFPVYFREEISEVCKKKHL